MIDFLKEKIDGLSKKMKSCLAVVVSLLVASTFAYDPNEDDPIYKLTWNSSQYLQEDGTIRAEYEIGWEHYLDETNHWANIDTEFVKNGNFYEVNKAPFSVKVPVLSTGTATFVSNNRWDNLEDEAIKDAPLTMNLTAQGVSEVQAKVETGDFGFGEVDYIVYPNAYPSIKGDLIYWVDNFPVPELKKIIRINENPNVGQDIKLCFNTGFNKAIDLIEDDVPKEGKIVTEDPIEIIPDGKDGPRKIVLDKAYIWHDWKSQIEPKGENFVLMPSDREEVTIEMDGQELCKTLPKTYLDNSEYPVYSDATVTFSASPGTADGYTLWGDLSGQTWTTGRNAAGVSWNNVDIYGLWGIYSNSNPDEWENFYRVKASYDTSSIPDGATINSVQIDMNLVSPVNFFGDKLAITSATMASNTVLDVADHAVANCGTTLFSGGVDMVNGPHLENLNADGVAHINKTGYTKFCFNSMIDVLNDEPTWSSERGSYGFLSTSEDNSLKLIVNYGPILNHKKIMPIL